MLYTSDESLNSTPETNIALPVNELRYKLKKKIWKTQKRDTNGKVKAPLGLVESQLWGLGPSESVIPQAQV